MTSFEFVCDEQNSGVRVDVYLAAALNKSRSHIQKLMETGRVLINQKVRPKNYKLQKGDVMQVEIEKAVDFLVPAQDIKLEIVYEDSYILVVNKPKGMVVHPAPGHSENTLVNALLAYCKDSLSGINGVKRPGIIHRIDKDTSGLLIVAKTDDAHTRLACQLKNHEIKRQYNAIATGSIKKDCDVIDKPVGRHPVNRKIMAAGVKNSKPAVTYYKVIERLNGFTHIVCNLKTGRTHQIRVHLKSIGHPIAGDKVYLGAADRSGLESQALCATRLEFIHPITGERIELSVDLPDYFKDFLIRRRIHG